MQTIDWIHLKKKVLMEKKSWISTLNLSHSQQSPLVFPFWRKNKSVFTFFLWSDWSNCKKIIEFYFFLYQPIKKIPTLRNNNKEEPIADDRKKSLKSKTKKLLNSTFSVSANQKNCYLKNNNKEEPIAGDCKKKFNFQNKCLHLKRNIF